MKARRHLFLVLALTAGLVGAKASKKDRSQARAELGRAYLSEGSLESAVRTLREATELDRTNWVAWNFLGLALAEKGKAEEAEDAFRRAVRFAPERAESHLNYGLFLFSQDRVDEAIAQYELALEDLAYRKPSFVLNNLGFALMSKGEWGRAQQVLQEAVIRAPNLCQARFNLGLAQQGGGEVKKAISTFEDVLEVCGDEATGAYLQLGILHLGQGDLDMATSYLYQAVDQAPESAIADEAQKLLSSLEP
jgi:type IV pilus assembly protein PilF